jgi:hypothetical protein
MNRERMKADMELVSRAQLENALTMREESSPTSLSKEDSFHLLAVMDQLTRRYPSQDQESSIEAYFKDFELLAAKHSLRKVEKALSALRIKPGQSFFPRPDEVAEEIERQAERGVANDARTEGEKFTDGWHKYLEQIMQPEEIEWRVKKFGRDPFEGKVSR